MTTESSHDDDRVPSATERVIALFGGVRPMAAKLEISASTIQGWKERDSIPETRHAEILTAAEKHDIALDPADLGGEKSEPPDGSESVALPEADDPEPDPPEPPKFTPDSVAPPIPPTPVPPPPPSAPADRLSARNGRALMVAIVALIVGIAGLIWAVVDGEIEASSDLSDISERVATLEARPAPQPVDLSGIEARLTALEDEVGSAADGSETQDLVDQIATLSDRVSALEQAPTGDQIQALSDRVSALEQSPTGDQIQSLTQQVQSLSETLSTLQATISGVQDTQATMRAALQALPTGEMLNNTSSSIDQRLAAFQTQIDQAIALARQNTGEGPALVLAVSQLREAVNSGVSYGSMLGSVDALAGGNDGLAQALGVLSDHATAGVPTFDMLAERFPEVADAIRAAARPAADGWFDSALNSVGSLVTVRRAPGENDGDDPDDITARAEARVAAGDWAGVEQALSSLTGAPADAAASWLGDLRARLAVNEALSSLQTGAVDALADAP